MSLVSLDALIKTRFNHEHRCSNATLDSAFWLFSVAFSVCVSGGNTLATLAGITHV